MMCRILILVLISIIALSINCKFQVSQGRGNRSRKEKKQKSTLSVTGLASTNVKTDSIKIQVHIVTKSMEASEALVENNQSSMEFLTQTGSLGINSDLITQTDYSITPKYNNTENPDTHVFQSIFDGYEVKNSLSIQLIDLPLTGKLIDAIVGIKGVQIAGVDFDVSPERLKEVEISLIDSAIDDATNKANQSLGKISYEIKKIKSMEVHSGKPQQEAPFRFERQAQVAMGAVSTTILGGQQEVSLYVQIVYSIGPVNSD